MKLLILFLISFNLFAQTMPNNSYKLGKASSTDDKGFVFDTGDGANNESLKINDSKLLKFSGNSLQVGDAVTGNDKCLVLDSTADSKFCWDGSEQKLTFNNGNGLNPKKIGSGSGSSGAGSNGFTVDNNPNAEDGTTGWTASAGTFATTATDPLESDLSFTWTPAAQNDTLKSDELDYEKSIFMGRACQANLTYTGGDDQLTLRVLNGDDEVLATQVLVAHSIAAEESIFFLCPSQAAITADADKGDLYFELNNVGATASVEIKFDNVYMGTLVGLSESTIPDVVSAFVEDGSGTTTVSLETADFVDGNCTNGAAGSYVCTFVTGFFTSVPNCAIQTHSRRLTALTPTLTDLTITMSTDSGATSDSDFSIDCMKTGTDAKQSVQVYKSIPRVSENTNVLAGQIANNGTVSITSITPNSLVLGNFTRNSTGKVTVDISSLGLTEAPSVTLLSIRGAGQSHVSSQSVTATDFVVNTFDTSNTPADLDFTYILTKTGVDFKMPTVQPILVNQVSTLEANGLHVQSCSINGTVSPTTDTADCDTWIDSLSYSVTITTVTLKAGVFSAEPSCSFEVSSNSNDTISGIVASTTSLTTRTFNTTSGTSSQLDFRVVCVGKR